MTASFNAGAIIITIPSANIPAQTERPNGLVICVNVQGNTNFNAFTSSSSVSLTGNVISLVVYNENGRNFITSFTSGST